ncbi:MAG: hypothetical protein OXU73_00045 [Candidatus Campbellbacteria bacterium]|nr:hypothetical protein [Candidatus Campbellbacteria bacterium]
MRKFSFDDKKFYETARSVAHSYGFEDINALFKKHKKRCQLKRCVNKRKENIQDTETYRFGNKIIRWFLQNSFQDIKGSSFVLYDSNVGCSELKTGKTRNKKCPARFNLAIAGVPQGLSEIYLMKVALSILSDLGIKDYKVKLNSVGDFDSGVRYQRELHKYLSKHTLSMNATCAQLFRENIFDAYNYINKHPDCERIKMRMPVTLRHLSDDSQNHFRFVVECLEQYSIPYTLSSSLIGPTTIYSHTMFKIIPDRDDVDPADQEFKVYGARYDNLALEKYGVNIPIATLTIEVNKDTLGDHIPKKTRPRKPRVFWLHAGQGAQVKSLGIIEELRQSKIPVAHKVYISRPTVQLEKQSNMEDFTHIVILGQQELLDSSVILKTIETKEQKTIPLSNLVRILKRL